jgi:hypothetical protein
MRSSPAFLLIVSFGYRDLFTIVLICWCNKVQWKWFFRSVDPAKPKNAKRKKKKESNSQPAGLSNTWLEPSRVTDDGDSDIEVGEPSAKKLKLPVLDSKTEDTEDDGSIQISAYIYVSSVAPQITRVGTKTIKTPAPKIRGLYSPPRIPR